MLEDPSAGRQGGQRTAPQRSNRVFILEYSPERSKSKKQKQIEPVEQRKEKLSSFLTRRDMLAEQSPAE
jgi:phosphopantetheine adenylyltransferase